MLRHPRYRIYTIIPDTTLENYDEALNIGVNARKRGALQLAIVALTRAVELNPLPSARAALAGAYRASGRLETAEQLYKYNIKRFAYSKNDVKFSKVGLAAVYRDMGIYGEAEKLYKDVLNQEPDNSYALNGLGAVYNDQGRLEEAAECFDKVDDSRQLPIDFISNLREQRNAYAANNDLEGVNRFQKIDFAFLLD